MDGAVVSTSNCPQSARRAGKERQTQPVFDKAHRMAHRGGAHAELLGGGRETAPARNGEDDGEAEEDVSLHC